MLCCSVVHDSPYPSLSCYCADMHFLLNVGPFTLSFSNLQETDQVDSLETLALPSLSSDSFPTLHRLLASTLTCYSLSSIAPYIPVSAMQWPCRQCWSAIRGSPGPGAMLFKRRNCLTSPMLTLELFSLPLRTSHAYHSTREKKLAQLYHDNDRNNNKKDAQRTSLDARDA